MTFNKRGQTQSIRFRDYRLIQEVPSTIEIPQVFN
ncbi:hypothetical protein CUAC110533_03050 [Cutibacterium acnes subsp. elongatum]